MNFTEELHTLVLQALAHGVGIAGVCTKLRQQAEVLEMLSVYHDAIVNGDRAP